MNTAKLKGFNYPLTPKGKSTLNPPPPWYYSSDFLDVNYADVAKACGCEGILVKDPAELGRAFRTAMEMQVDQPVLIDVRTTTDPAKMLPGVDARTRMKTSS